MPRVTEELSFTCAPKDIFAVEPKVVIIVVMALKMSSDSCSPPLFLKLDMQESILALIASVGKSLSK